MVRGRILPAPRTRPALRIVPRGGPLPIWGPAMADKAKQDALAELLADLALQQANPEPVPPAQPVDVADALEQIARTMAVMYPTKRKRLNRS